MIYPKFLKERDTIGVTAPSDGVIDSTKVNRLNNAIKNMENLNFKIIETKNVRTSIKGSSSSINERAKQLIELYLNDEVKMIMCVAGGEFLLEILPFLDFDIIKNNPKWLQGFSDPTGLLFTITTNLDIATIYSDNFCSFGMEPWHQSLKNNIEILKGNLITQNSFSKYEERIQYVSGLEPYYLINDVKWENLFQEKKIEITGRIIGGCIDILSELFGTRFDKTLEFIEKYKDDGIIWYFDNCELTSEGLIRTLWKFKDNGWFKYTKGIIFGRSATESSSLDISLKEAVKHSLGNLKVPIIMNADIGHVSPRMTIINGALAKIVSESGKGSITFELK